MPVLLALFAVYVLAVTWQMRRALATSDVAVRQREARRLLFVVSAGIPLLGAFVLVAF
jgi:hypothetical protein